MNRGVFSPEDEVVSDLSESPEDDARDFLPGGGGGGGGTKNVVGTRGKRGVN
jgi:hypothetical protein